MRIKSYRIDCELISHDALRITNLNELDNFLINIAEVPNEVHGDVFGFIVRSNHNYFQFAGDGDGLGFIVDVWNNRELEGEPIDSLQIWLDEYREFM